MNSKYALATWPNLTKLLNWIEAFRDVFMLVKKYFRPLSKSQTQPSSEIKGGLKLATWLAMLAENALT